MPIADLVHPELGAYESKVVMPDDFVEFWASTIAEARSAGGAVDLRRAETSLKVVETYDVTFPGFGGHPIKGWLIMPAIREGRLPLVIQYIGYGGGRGLPHEQLHWAASGYAYFRMDTRGQGGEWSVGDTADPVGSTAAFPGFMTRGVLDRNDYYYRRLLTDCVRAVDALIDLPFIDAERIAVCGDSQGGGMSIAAAGLDPRIKAVMADVPFLCDFPRAVQVALREPYTEIVGFLARHRDKRDRVFETLTYFDCVNFARFSKARALFSVAMMDEVCPPSTVYAAFNAYAGDKRMVEYDFNNHEGGGAYHDREQMFWLGELFGID
ncbi:acetylxylan esterase [Rhizobium hidalgonense]|uniref:Acetylxylan esterase n=1 Tax=Rhizobium hidalgonense TaxID=1538159 RepID=A0A2A6K931_9HYPH|nr:acetylxylan esterase [Rhizobium hidalgonense]MDR9776984.1 acetylxylan esterase [Rhizobium hidalgonense]MDR9813965.1 acetylxylan esterase [Rhizobium hidalgonense]MDR9820717.1 acetylxylan esterase [Rhizobium hidalgonense]PDT21406.1 acetylxylan esterase [Rhizobium hidalgonense]PON08064.1 acetylxylan esterase [Rhizobium hidalgonense]